MRSLYVFVLLFVLLTVSWGEEKKEEPADDPITILKEVAESWYDLDEQGLNRYTSLVTCSDVAKTLETRGRVIIEQAKYEMVYEPGKPLKVRVIDIPNYFGSEARDDANTYARLMEGELVKFFKSVNPINDLLELLGKVEQSNRFEVTMEKDKSLDKIILKEKKTAPPKGGPLKRRLGRNRDENKDEAEEKNDQDAGSDEEGSIYIWVNKDKIIEKAEVVNQDGKIVMVVKAAKYKKLWNLSSLEVTKYDRKGDFDERARINLLYTYVQNMMLPASLTLSRHDKEGKLLERRGEVNPLIVKFSKHEVELK
ncbi:MAG: hypothetical protein AAB019_03055 [Planctomycetota bacterium]